MKFSRYILWMLSAYLLLVPAAHAEENPTPQTLPVIEGGWNGADAAYSRSLPDGKRLWVFGDTLVGPVEEGRRTEAGEMYRNAVGIEAADGTIHYDWGASEQGIFENKRLNEWYWPADFVIHEGKAYFFLRRMIMVDRNDPLGFKVVGVDLARVDNLKKPSEKWRIGIAELPYNGLTFGIAATIKDDYVYALATDEGPNQQLFAARIALKDLAAGTPNPEYYDAGVDSWVEGQPSMPAILHGSAEGSLAFDEEKEQWRFVYSPGGISRQVMMRTSDKLTMNWSEPELLYTCPEAEWSESYFCYAGKEVHGKKPFSITYSVNSFVFTDLEEDARIYIPRVVAVEK